MGGNSTKATSGINGAGTNAQRQQGIPDTAETFFADTKKSVCNLCDTDILSLMSFLRLANSLVMT